MTVPLVGQVEQGFKKKRYGHYVFFATSISVSVNGKKTSTFINRTSNKNGGQKKIITLK